MEHITKSVVLSIIIGTVLTLFVNDLNTHWIDLNYFGHSRNQYQKLINDVFTITGVCVYVGLLLEAVRRFLSSKK